MNKFLIGIILMIFFASAVQAITNTKPETSISSHMIEPTAADFTHTVFAEQFTTTWCPNCPTAAEALDNIYQSGDYPFYYVALVNDMNPIAKQRNRAYAFGLIKIYGYPSVYFDGGDTNMIGRYSNVQQTENEYRTLIQQEGQRTPRQPITLESDVAWDGNAKITITVTATNEGNFFYFGKLRAYITEIESRWLDSGDRPYDLGFLDFAINRFIFLFPNKPKTITVTWDGNADHQGQTFGDITADNIMVISTISHWFPHHRIAHISEELTQRYFAFYVDQTTAANPI